MKKLLILAIVLLSFSSCGIYSFTGASIPPEASTISVTYFPNNALQVQPTLSQTFTDELRDRFSSQTTLTLIDGEGDLALEGEITDYKVMPVAIQGDQTAALNRLTIEVKVRFFNKFEESKNFDRSFSRYVDYDSNQDLSTVEEGLIEEITEMLVDDIFNAAVVNW